MKEMRFMYKIVNPYSLAILLLSAGLFYNLGLLPLIDDEGIRALVALEMDYTGDLITPTTGGEIYLKKPPLYNWIILLSYNLTGLNTEFAIRLPMVVSLFIYGFLIYYFNRSFFGKKNALILALMVVTAARILFYESLFGLIDITFSWVVYLNFMIVFRYLKKKNYKALFLLSYLLALMAYFLKGLPAIVFQGITLLVAFTDRREFRRLFSKWHFMAFFLFAGLIAAYYIEYVNRNGIEAQTLLNTLWNESAQRTAIQNSLPETLGGILVFPFEMFYSFLPWTLFLLLLFKKGALKKIMRQPYLRYCALVFFFNFLIYWTSPGVHFRYLLMFLPLMFCIGLYLYIEYKTRHSVLTRIIEYAFLSFSILLALGILASPFLNRTGGIPRIVAFSIFLGIIMIWSIVKMIRQGKQKLVYFLIVMGCAKLFFNKAVLEARYEKSTEVRYKASTQEAARLTRGKPLYGYWPDDFPPNPNYGRRLLNYRMLFYLTREKDKIVPIREEMNDTSAYYVIQSPYLLRNIKHDIVYEIEFDDCCAPRMLVKFKEED